MVTTQAAYVIFGVKRSDRLMQQRKWGGGSWESHMLCHVDKVILPPRTTLSWGQIRSTAALMLTEGYSIFFSFFLSFLPANEWEWLFLTSLQHVNEHKRWACGRVEKTVGRLYNASARFNFYYHPNSKRFAKCIKINECAYFPYQHIHTWNLCAITCIHTYMASSSKYLQRKQQPWHE